MISSESGNIYKILRTLILLIILILFLFGCSVKAQYTQLSTPNTALLTPSIIYTEPPTSHPSLKEKTKATSTVTFTPTITITSFSNENFHFGATPQTSQIGGIDGIYFRQDTRDEDESCIPLYDVFRFYDNGFVMYVVVCADNDIRDFSISVWPYMSQWFYRESIDKTTSQGIYYIAENKIWFTTIAEYTSHTVVSDYFGTFSKDKMTLDRFTYPSGYQIKESKATEEFIRLDLHNAP